MSERQIMSIFCEGGDLQDIRAVTESIPSPVTEIDSTDQTA